MELGNQDDPHMSNYHMSPLVKLKKAYHWPINPITDEAVGGRLCYHCPDECMKNRADIWPRVCIMNEPFLLAFL